MDIEDILIEMEEIITEAKKVIFNPGAVIVNAEVLLSNIEKIRQYLPDCIVEARILKAKAEKDLLDGSQKVATILNNAKAKAEEMIAESTIVKKANLEAQSITNEAKDCANRILSDVRHSVDLILNDIDNRLGLAKEQIVKAIDWNNQN